MRIVTACVALLLVAGAASGDWTHRGRDGNIVPLPGFLDDEGREFFGRFGGTHRPQSGGVQDVSFRIARDGYVRLEVHGDGLQPAQTFRGGVDRTGRFYFVDVTDHRRTFSGRIDRGRLTGALNRAGQRQGVIRAENRIWRLQRHGIRHRLVF